MGAIKSFISAARGSSTKSQIGVLGVASAGVDGVSTYALDRMENPDSSALVSGAKAVGTAAAWMLAEPLMWGLTIGEGVAGLAKMGMDEAEKERQLRNSINMHVRESRSGEMGGTLGGGFQDTEQAATMRQRQMDIMRQHKISTEAVLGSEARQLHR